MDTNSLHTAYRPVPYLEEHVRRILATLSRATLAEHAHGREWYARAKRAAARIGRAYGVPLRTVVGVMAALSPNNRWERNLTDAETLVAAWIAGRRVSSVKVCTYRANRAKAWAIMNLAGREYPSRHDGILAILNGPKVTAFYGNIMGLPTVTIDGHAANIALGERRALKDGTIVGVALYRQLVAAYIEAGRRAGMSGSTVQAITWVVWRRQHGITD